MTKINLMINNFNRTDIIVVFDGQICCFVNKFATRYIMENLEVSPSPQNLFLLFLCDIWIFNFFNFSFL